MGFPGFSSVREEGKGNLLTTLPQGYFMSLTSIHNHLSTVAPSPNSKSPVWMPETFLASLLARKAQLWMNPSPVLMYQQCVADTSGGGELRLEWQNHEDTSLALPTQVLSGIYVSGSLSARLHTCTLHPLLQLLSVWRWVCFICPTYDRLSIIKWQSSVGTCPRPPGDSSPSSPQPQGPDLMSLSFSACPTLWYPWLLAGLVATLIHMLVPWCWHEVTLLSQHWCPVWLPMCLSSPFFTVSINCLWKHTSTECCAVSP